MITPVDRREDAASPYLVERMREANVAFANGPDPRETRRRRAVTRARRGPAEQTPAASLGGAGG